MTRIPLSDEEPTPDDDVGDSLLDALTYLPDNDPWEDCGGVRPVDFHTRAEERSRFPVGERETVDGRSSAEFYRVLCQPPAHASAAHLAYLELLAQGHFDKSLDRDEE